MKPDTETKTYIRPMRVFVGHKTKAEQGFRSRISMPQSAALAPGVPPTPEHDLIFNGEKLSLT